MSKNKKKKKQKITYIDDGRTLYDMSQLSGGGRAPKNLSTRGGCKEQFQTYIRAVRSMLLPMFVVMGGICIVFLILYLVFEFASH